MLAVEIAFWASVALVLYTHAGYPLVLWAIALLRRGAGRGAAPADGPAESAAGPPGATATAALPSVSLIVAARDEERVIERKVANALALDYPRELFEVVVASDGSGDRTVELARAAGADVVLDLPGRGKLSAQDAAAERARGEVLAFSDANSWWSRDALRRLVATLGDPRAGYVCGAVRFTDEHGANQEGLYWRYELAVRRLESQLAGVTAGNGAIYAVRREAYLPLPPSRSHDLSFPFALTKRGWRAVYEPAAVAEEKMVPSIEGEFERKRRMNRGLWDIVVRDGMLWPRGYSPAYAFQIASHRLLRYASPLLHLIALAANVALVAAGAGWLYWVTLGGQLAVAAAAAAAPLVPARPMRLARYYVLVTASIAAGFWDRLRSGPTGGWEKAPGTR